jgi:hypothetical protein
MCLELLAEEGAPASTSASGAYARTALFGLRFASTTVLVAYTVIWFFTPPSVVSAPTISATVPSSNVHTSNPKSSTSS